MGSFRRGREYYGLLGLEFVWFVRSSTKCSRTRRDMDKKKKTIVKKKKKMPTKIDWGLMEKEYVASEEPVPLSHLARRYGVSNRITYVRAAEGGWVQKRIDYWRDIHDVVLSEVRDRVTRQRINRFHDVAGLIDDVIRNLMEQDNVSEMTVSDLTRLLEVERSIVNNIPDVSRDVDQMDEIVETQILMIQRIGSARGQNIENLVNNGLHRLGILSPKKVQNEAEEPKEGQPVESVLQINPSSYVRP